MGLAAAVIFTAIGFAISAGSTTQQKKSWPIAAARLGLDIELRGLFSSPTIRGRIGEISVEVTTTTVDKQQCTQYWITYPPDGPTVRIRRQLALHRVAKFFGANDVEVGDPRFDDALVVDSAHPEQTRAFLTPTRQAAVLALFAQRHVVTELTQDTIVVATGGFERGPDAIVAMVDRLVAVAQVLGHPAAVDAALELQQQGELGSAIDELHTINTHNPNVFTQMLEVEALVEHGEHERARQVLAPALDAGVPEADGWKRVADAPAPVLLPAPTPAEAVVRGRGQQVTIDDLFGSHRRSYEVAEQFEAEYVNKRVSWSGTVTQVHTYRHDNDFGEGPGLKAMVLLGSSGSGSLISNEVHAVLQLGIDEPIERGRSISFDGTLQHVDRFARKLYLSSGTLT